VSPRNRKMPDAALATAENGPRRAPRPAEDGTTTNDLLEADGLRAQVVELVTENAKLSRENAALREAVAARDTFLAVAAHELRNPMTPIRGRVQLLRRMLRKSADDAFMPKLERGLEQVEWLIEQYVKRATTLLDVSRATTGKLHLDMVAVDLGALVRDIAQDFTPVADHAGTPLEVRAPPGPVVCRGDKLALEQVIDNLVSNALKYGAGKPVVVRVADECSADGTAGTCIVRVRDRGAGISPQDQARIFDRFERAVRPGEHGGGFGVGLWIVQQFVQAMGGAVEVASTLGQGSTFTVRLPRSNSSSESTS
jgi:two-component system, OmpR family, sensor kinase